MTVPVVLLWQWYIRDPKTDEPLLTLIDGEPHYYELDWRMMPIRLWGKEGDLVWQANADAWGGCQPEMSKGYVHQPIRLPGQFQDELTGIVQNRFREYSSDKGRYLTSDPLGLEGGLNGFRYTSNPLDSVDPLGLYPTEVKPNSLLASEAEDAPLAQDDTPLLAEVGRWLGEFGGRATEVVQSEIDYQVDLYDRTGGWGNVFHNPGVRMLASAGEMAGYGVGAIFESALSPNGMSPKVGKYWADIGDAIKDTVVGTMEGDGAAAFDMSTLLVGRRVPGVSSKLNTPERVRELRAQGHGPQRHSGLTEQQLVERVFDGIDPATGTRVDLVRDPKFHKKPSEATTFLDDEAFVRAEQSVRNSAAFQEAIKLNPERPVVKVSLGEALGEGAQSQVRGVRKVGPRENREFENLDFSNGSVQAFYQYDAGTSSYNLETMFPTQYPAN